MIPLSDLRNFVKAAGDAVSPLYDDVIWEVGFTAPQVPGRYVLFTFVPGTGLATEGVTDIGGIDIDVAGRQNDYASAESLAAFVDRTLLGGGGSRQMGSHYIISLDRFGSSPYNSETDDSDREHFAASYLIEVGSGLALST